MKTIKVNLDDHLEEFVQKMIDTGEYTCLGFVPISHGKTREHCWTKTTG